MTVLLIDSMTVSNVGRRRTGAVMSLLIAVGIIVKITVRTSTPATGVTSTTAAPVPFVTTPMSAVGSAV